MNIILLGGPGSGKSTYAKFITKEFGLEHIYPGDLLRKKAETNPELAKSLSKGEFAPNEIVLDLIKNAVANAKNGAVFDGYPRYMQQVEDLQREGIKIDKVIYLNVSEEEVIRRLTARGRLDDKPEIIKDRIALYQKETGPVVDYYKSKSGFIEIKAEGENPETIAKMIIDKIKANPKTFNEFKESIIDLVCETRSYEPEVLEEAEYQGRTVTLNSPFRTPKGPKKFAVYTKNESGNTVIVRFGDPNMEIKRDDPARRKSFRARHNCDNPGPKWKARYWSCQQWRAGTKVQG
jgi:adenylate kinase